jgi:hypothetical protein
LNVRSSDKIFRDLPELEPTHTQRQRSVPELINKFSMTAKTKRHSKEFEEEITDLLKDISNIDTSDLKITPLPNEVSFLGLTKSSSPNLLTITKRDEDRNFLSSLLQIKNDLKHLTDDERFQFDFKSLEGWQDNSESLSS